MIVIIHHNGDRTMLYSGIYGPSENLLHFIRLRTCGDIPVLRFPAEERVTDAPSHRISLESGLCQCLQNLFYLLRYLHICLFKS